MDDIFTLIVVIIAIVSAVGKIKAKQKSAEGARPAKPGELATKLKAFFAEIQRSFDIQTSKGASGASRWGRLMQRDNIGISSGQHYDISLENLELEDEDAPAEPKAKPPQRSTRFETKPSEKQPVIRPPDLSVPQPAPAITARDLAFLRKAVVWSEILGPPVALRDFSGDR